MKKIALCLMLIAGSLSAKAALFVSNNTGCDIALELYAHDATLPAPCSYFVWFKVPPLTAQAYANVTDFNPPGNGWRLTSVGPSGYTTMTATGADWDAVGVHHYPAPGNVGNPGTCATGTSHSSVHPGTGCTYTLTWTNLGGGNVLVQVDP